MNHEPGRKSAGESEYTPYRNLAGIYDDLVGYSAFECWKENFDRLVNRYSICFEVAADVACGTGLAAAYLGGRCERVYAVDRSPWMLEVAGERCSKKNITLLEQSLQRLELPEKVDMLTCNFDSLNYLVSEDDLAIVIEGFAHSIKPGGYLMFDINTSRELAGWQGHTVPIHMVPGGFSVWEFDWDPETCINELLMTNFVEVSVGLYVMSREVHTERSYGTELVMSLLLGSGFFGVEARDARMLASVGDDTRRVQYLARRRWEDRRA